MEINNEKLALFLMQIQSNRDLAKSKSEPSADTYNEVINLFKTMVGESFTCEECEGTGVTYEATIEMVCCGEVYENGECCGNPIGMPAPEIAQCEVCDGTGKITVR